MHGQRTGHAYMAQTTEACYRDCIGVHAGRPISAHHRDVRLLTPATLRMHAGEDIRRIAQCFYKV